MKRFRFVAALVFAVTTGAALATNVNVHVNVGEPTYYGRIDTSGYPRPQVIYAEPTIVERSYVTREPLYLRVPQSQAQNWRSYCRNYSACNRPVYFVEDRWYNDVYAPQYRDRHAEKAAAK